MPADEGDASLSLLNRGRGGRNRVGRRHGCADQFFATCPMLPENEAVLLKPVTVRAFLEAVSRP